MLGSIKSAIDMLEIERLWKLAYGDPKGLINKISIRQLGKKRIEKLYTYLLALDKAQLAKNHSFELLLLTCCENELGVGLFVKQNTR